MLHHSGQICPRVDDKFDISQAKFNRDYHPKIYTFAITSELKQNYGTRI